MAKDRISVTKAERNHMKKVIGPIAGPDWTAKAEQDDLRRKLCYSDTTPLSDIRETEEAICRERAIEATMQRNGCTESCATRQVDDGFAFCNCNE